MRQVWEAEYERISNELMRAYEGAGVDHDDDELYDGQNSLGGILEHYDHDLEGRQRSRAKARRESRRASRLEANGGASSAGDEQLGEAEEDALEAMASKSGGAIDGATAVRHAQVVRQNRQAGHPFSTLRASSSVGSWWPVNSNAKPAWGSSRFGQGPAASPANSSLMPRSSSPVPRPHVAVRI